MVKQSELGNRLKEKGYKLTGPRKIILKYILDTGIKHFSSQELYKLIEKKNPGIGMATVYRTLALLEEEGIICKVYFGDDCIRYEINDENEVHGHHHLVCQQCGKVIELKYDLLEDIERKIFLDHGFKVVDHEVKFIGICSDCAKNTAKDE